MSLTVRQPALSPPAASQPRAWLGGNLTISRFYDVAGLLIPPMERFGASTVHRLRARAPEMSEDLRAFCGQEAQHGRVHRRFHTLLEEQGLDVKPYVARMERLLARMVRWISLELQLSVVVALEHNFACLSDMTLRDGVMDEAEPEQRDLWCWHSVEELEHKAVAFRLYQIIGAPWWHRQLGMLIASALMWPLLVLTTFGLLAQEPGHGLAGWWRDRAAWQGAGKPSVRQLALRYALPYLSRDFHPDEVDHEALIAEALAAVTPRLGAA